MNRKANSAIVLSVTLAILIFLAFLTVVFYTYKQTGELRILSGELQELRQEEASVIGLRKLLTETSETRTTFDSHNIRRSEIVPYIEELEDIARDAGLIVDVRTVTTNDQPTNTGDRTGEILTLELEVRGPFGGVMETIYRLEALPYTAYLQSLRLEFIEEGEWAAYLRVDGLGYINDEG